MKLMTTIQELSEKAKNNLGEIENLIQETARKAEERKKERDEKVLKLKDQEHKILYFDLEKARVVDVKYIENNVEKVTKKVVFECIEPTADPPKDWTFFAGIRTATAIKEFLKKSINTLEILRNGTGTTTTYIITPAQ